jgi:thioredoxin reductase (NADPH)
MSVTKPTLRSEATFSIGLQLLTYRRLLFPARWRSPIPLARAPMLLETTAPGVFVVGDVRASSIKRVASAVGEGSICIQFVYTVLAEG